MNDLNPRPSTLRVQHAPALDGAGPHEHRRRREAAVDRRRRRDAALAAPRAGIDVDREHLDALDHHQPLAVVVRPGLDARIGTIAPRHRTIDRIVDVAFDDEEAGEAAGDLIVRGAVGVRVIPVRAGRMRLRRRTRPARAPAARCRADARTAPRRRARAARARGTPESVDDLRVWPSARGRIAQKRVVADRAVRR